MKYLLLLSLLVVHFSYSLRYLQMSGTRNVRVTTYNVLSSHLARADYFSFCNPKWLQASYRLMKVKEKIDAEVAKKSIICLQEVSTVWAGSLHVYFAARGYHFVTGLYGNKFNGYMGVGMAVPLSEYDVLDVDITRIADTKTVARKKHEKGILATLKNLFYWPLVRFFKALGILPEKQKSVWDESLNRFNQMVSMRLQPKGIAADDKMGSSDALPGASSPAASKSVSSFVVGTYHMPCTFRIPQVMMIHCALSAQHIDKFASGSPYIYCGDFNIKPDSPMYTLLTNGKVDSSIPEYPVSLDSDNWKPEVAPLKSCYKELLGKEPEYTNNARIVDQEPFIETLDYIFMSSGHSWKVHEVESLETKHPAKADVKEPLPSEHEPSDHILLSADMQLKFEESA